MAINFANVKRLQITDSSNNTVEVIKIQNASNVVLWQRKVVTSITLSGQNTSLNKDSTFIFGGTVTAHYNDNTTANVTTSTTFSGYDMSTAGSQTVTATYTEEGVTVTATYTLTVVAEGWHTLWQGTATITNNKGTVTGNTNNLCTSASGTGTSPKLRITFSFPSSGNSGMSTSEYYVNGGGTGSAPSSPQTINAINANQNIHIIGRMNEKGNYNLSSHEYRYVSLQKTNNSSDHVTFKLTGWSSVGSNAGSAAVSTSMTITKIEQYY